MRGNNGCIKIGPLKVRGETGLNFKNTSHLKKNTQRGSVKLIAYYFKKNYVTKQRTSKS